MDLLASLEEVHLQIMYSLELDMLTFERSKAGANIDISVILRPRIVMWEPHNNFIVIQPFLFSLSELLFIHKWLRSGTLLSRGRKNNIWKLVSFDLYFCTQR